VRPGDRGPFPQRSEARLRMVQADDDPADMAELNADGSVPAAIAVSLCPR
jgi:hypothetical protein